jgi:hypothetical protein
MNEVSLKSTLKSGMRSSALYTYLKPTLGTTLFFPFYTRQSCKRERAATRAARLSRRLHTPADFSPDVCLAKQTLFRLVLVPKRQYSVCYTSTGILERRYSNRYCMEKSQARVGINGVQESLILYLSELKMRLFT